MWEWKRWYSRFYFDLSINITHIVPTVCFFFFNLRTVLLRDLFWFRAYICFTVYILKRHFNHKIILKCKRITKLDYLEAKIMNVDVIYCYSEHKITVIILQENIFIIFSTYLIYFLKYYKILFSDITLSKAKYLV